MPSPPVVEEPPVQTFEPVQYVEPMIPVMQPVYAPPQIVETLVAPPVYAQPVQTFAREIPIAETIVAPPVRQSVAYAAPGPATYTPAVYETTSQGLFNQIDTNHDGQLSPQEMAAWRM